MANHEEKTFIFGNEVMKAEAGSVVTSEMKLSEKWKWSRKKVRCFLSLLQELDMIEKKSFNKGTTLVIKNYSKYQKKDTSEDTTKDTTQTLINKGFVDGLGTSKNTSQGTSEDTTEDTTEDTQTITKNNYTITMNKERENKEREESVSRYGEYNNVILSDEELKKLREEAPEVYLKKIEDLSCYMKSTGKGYKSHYATIRNWIKKDQKKEGESVESGDKGKVFNVEDFL
jgi:DNA replication protein DnaD